MKTKEVDILKSRIKMYCFSMRVTVYVVLTLLRNSEQSIAGVTYMDDFDFELRYRDIHECDPFYWYPLHLPERCAEMYEKLIRSKIGSSAPVRVATKKKKSKYKSYREYDYEYETESSEDSEEPEAAPVVPVEITFESPFNYISPFTYDFTEQYNYKPSYKHLSPYEKMLGMLRRDVKENPSAPVIKNIPLFGLAAVYNQSISRKSETLIKKMANLYSKIEGPTDNNFNYYGEMNITPRLDGLIDEANNEKKTNDNTQGLEPQKSSSHRRRRPKVIEKILPNGDRITVIKQKHR